MISKELLSEVLKDKQIENMTLRGDKLWFRQSGLNSMSIKWSDFCINIYELAHKCKELALSKGYIIDERGVNVYTLSSDGIDVIYSSYGKPFCPHRVFEHCEWIMMVDKNKV